MLVSKQTELKQVGCFSPCRPQDDVRSKVGREKVRSNVPLRGLIRCYTEATWHVETNEVRYVLQDFHCDADQNASAVDSSPTATAWVNNPLSFFLDAPGFLTMMLFTTDVGRDALSDVLSSCCNKWPATNPTQLSLGTDSCAIQETCIFLKLVDKDGRFKPPYSCDRNRIEGLAHLARSAHFFRYKVASGSSWCSTNEIRSWITIRSHASLGQTARLKSLSFCLCEMHERSA